MSLIDEIKFFLKSLNVNNYLIFFAVVLLIILVVSLIYLLVSVDTKDDLSKISKKIEREYKPVKVEFSDFEIEQEQNAIISYNELISSSKNFELNYSEETIVDGLNISKVNSDEMFTEKNEDDFSL